MLNHIKRQTLVEDCSPKYAQILIITLAKATVLAFAIALELDLDEAKNSLAHAGYTLFHSYKFDIIVEYFIIKRNYDIYKINEALFEFD